MGGCCCACLKPKDESQKLSEDAPRDNPAYKKDYGSIRTESEHEGPPKESDSLLKTTSARPKLPDQPVKREAPIPKENLSLERTKEKQKEQKPEKEVVPPPPTTVVVPATPPAKGAGHVKFAPAPPSTSTPVGSTADEEEKSEKSEKSERSESDTTPLVPDDKEKTQAKDSKSKKKGKTKFGVASKMSKTAGKMKKALTRKDKEDIAKKYQQKPTNQGSQGFDRGKLERVSSSRMKSKYARERLEKIEKEREDKERLQQQTGGFRDPRKAAAERGEKLGELDDATGEMKTQAAGFAQTTHQLAKAMKK